MEQRIYSSVINSSLHTLIKRLSQLFVMDKVFPGLFYLPLKGQSSGGLRDRTTGTKRWTNKSNPAVTPHPLSIYNTPLGGASVVTRSEAVMSRGVGGGLRVVGQVINLERCFPTPSAAGKINQVTKVTGRRSIKVGNHCF